MNKLIPTSCFPDMAMAPFEHPWGCHPYWGWECTTTPNQGLVQEGNTRILCFSLLVIISIIKCRNPSICLRAMAGSSQRCTRALHKLEHRKCQSDITKQIFHRQLGQTPGKTPKKPEGTPSLGGFQLNQTWCWAIWSKLLLLWALQILLTQTTLCVTLGPKPFRSARPGSGELLSGSEGTASLARQLSRARISPLCVCE